MQTQNNKKLRSGPAIPNVLVPLSAADHSELLKRLQLARAINVSTRTVDNWQRQKKIPSNSEPHYAVLYSNDGGKSWRPLDFGLTRNSFTVKTRYLAGGEDCRFRVLASAGVRTSSAESKSFVVPRKGPQALIKDLNLARTLGEGKNVTLEGGAFSPETGSIDSGDLIWTSNLDGKIGTGRRISTAKLSVGRHLITLTATGPDGGQSTSQTMVQVTRNSA